LLGISALPVRAETQTFYPTQDTHISEYYPDADYSDADLIAAWFDTCQAEGPCDRDGDGYVRRSPLLSFDLSAIPLGSTITSCELHLECSLVTYPGPVSGPAEVLTAFRVTSPWNENVTWYSRPSWTDVLAPDVTVGSRGPVVMDHSELSQIVQLWVSGTAPNYGLLLWLQEGGFLYFNVTLYSKETAPDADTKPYLKVSYLITQPQVSDIPDQTVCRGEPFGTFDLDDYVTDIDHAKEQLNWSYSGNSDLSVTIDPSTHLATVTYPGDWSGSETITFRATDPGDLWGEDSATFTVVSGPPDPPTNLGRSQVTQTSITWTWQDNSDNEQGFYLEPVGIAVPANTTSKTETGLSPNTSYPRQVRAHNACGDSDLSDSFSAYTLPTAPDVSCDKSTGVSHPVETDFIFTNLAGWGPGSLDHYHYAWDQSSSHTWTGTESTWNSGTLALMDLATGDWYLHLMSHNPAHESGGTGDYGPYTVAPVWPQDTTGQVRSSPALGDLDGDGPLEVVVGSADGSVYVWRADGRLAPGWPQAAGGEVRSSPVLGDLDGDGLFEVLVGSAAGNVYAWHADGTPVTGWPRPTGGLVHSSPALGYLDGDRLLEIVVGSHDGKVHAWHADGSVVAGWPQSSGQVYSSPALGDLDGDGAAEVIVGSLDFHVYAWHSDGTPVAGWPQPTQGAVHSSPALGDLDGDGAPEVVVGSTDGSVYAWHGDGTLAAGWPRATDGEVHSSSAAIGDLDGDGLPDVVVGATDGKVYAWHGNGGPIAGWPRTTGGSVYSSPALGHVDDDGTLEVIVGSYDGNVYAWHADGTAVEGWPRTTGGQVHSSAALADLDRDGMLDVVVGSDDGEVYAWPNLAATDRIAPWPMFRHDKFHTGNYRTGPFPDVPSDWWASQEIEACVRGGIVAGYPDGRYHPEYSVSRDQMAVFISRALAGATVPTGPEEATFDDVPTDHWAYKYVEYCVANGVVQGFDPVTYGPTIIVSRDAMAVFIARAVAGGDGSVPGGPVVPTFNDVPAEHWAYKYVEYCAANDIVHGYDPVTYGPTITVSRDQMAVFISRAFGLM